MSIDLRGRAAIVTGGGHGIGRALVEALAERGARVAVADVNTARAEKVAARVGGIAVECDVGDPAAVKDLVATAERELGPIELAASNAGVTGVADALSVNVDEVRRITDINLLAHVWMAQEVVPGMVERGHGALVQTISSAALITGPSGMGYTLTKHGALGFAEWVALNYSHLGIRVACLCPNAVYTGMLGRDEDTEVPGAGPDADFIARIGEVIQPEDAAAAVLQALDDGRFLALPHPRVGESFARKAQDYDAWLERTAGRLRRMRGQEM
jgi:NAD(P)-dependent dehydrogenase (short-subunit alcohol dehydrogenase family)